MPQPESDLPEGTDQIIDGAAETSASPPAATQTGDAEGGTVFSSLKGQMRDTTQSLRQQAGDRARDYALQGKDRATGALDEFVDAINEAAALVDRRLGAEYGDYARRAATAVENFSGSIRDKDVDDLYDDARELIRKSPTAAVGIAAALGFALVRVVKAGLTDDDDNRGGRRGGGRSAGA